MQESTRRIRLGRGDHAAQFFTQLPELLGQDPQFGLDIILIFPLAHERR
jgi:hypothetical protein